MKPRIMSTIAIAAIIVCIGSLLAAVVAYPMHIGEPSYYHIARVDCLLVACTCGLSAILATIASAKS